MCHEITEIAQNIWRHKTTLIDLIRRQREEGVRESFDVPYENSHLFYFNILKYKTKSVSIERCVVYGDCGWNELCSVFVMLPISQMGNFEEYFPKQFQ